jgi:hypothetical protein
MRADSSCKSLIERASQLRVQGSGFRITGAPNPDPLNFEEISSILKN